jgi:very-short-patch-repair endonuclease
MLGDRFAGRTIWRPLLVEVDGGSWLPKGRHTTGSGFEKDAEKLNAAAELGYRVLRFTPRMVEDGSALAQIQRILSKSENTDAA